MGFYRALLALFGATSTDAAPAPPPLIPSSRADSPFVNYLSGLGMSIDKGQAAQIDVNRRLLVETEIDALCAHDGVATRITALLPENATRSGWYVQDSSDDADPMQDEDERLDIEAKVREGTTWALKYGNAWTMMVVEEEDPEGKGWAALQALPLDMSRVRRVLSLINLDTLQCSARTYESYEGSNDFGLPATYTVSVGVSGTDLNGLVVHRSRLIRWTGVARSSRERLENAGRDLSIIQVAIDAIRSAATMNQSAANYVQDMGVAVMKSPILAANSASDQRTAYNALMAAMAAGKSLLRMVMLAPDEVFERSSASVSGFKDLDDNARSYVCAATGYPMTLLWGAEPGGLSTDDASGRINWYARVEGYQVTDIRPGLRQLYKVLYAQKDGPTKGVAPKGWRVEFHPLQAESPAQQIANQKAAADLDKLNIEMGVYDVDAVRRARYSKRGWRPAPPVVEALPSPAAQAAAPGAPASASAAVADSGAALPPEVLVMQIPEGTARRGVGADGQPWSVTMPGDYGELKGTRGLDGEPVDYLLRRAGPRGRAFVVEQLLPPDEVVEGDEAGGATDELDEYKVILGCADEAEARALLATAYGSSGRFGAVAAMPEAVVLDWLRTRGVSGRATIDAIDMRPPKGVREELKRGLDWHAEGKSGDGLVPTTVAWARRLARGEPISPKKATAMRAYFLRHAVDKRGKGYEPGEPGYPSPGRVAWALWGGEAGKSWSNDLVEQLNRAKRA